MSRLALAFTDSSAGCLKAARLADCVMAVGQRFVWGRLPSSSQLDALLSPRSALREASEPHWLDNLTGRQFEEARGEGLGLVEFCARFDAVDLWVDPDPNSQLQLIWILDFLRPHARITARLATVQMDAMIGDQRPDELAAHQPRLIRTDSRHFETASASWTAWRAPTPEAWFDLLNWNLEALPQLRTTIISLLEELPARDTGLGATEMRMLELIAEGHVPPYDLFPGHQKPNARRTYGYWEIGALLDGLARCPVPAVAGLDEGPFALDMHDEPDRHRRYQRSRLALTELGEAIIARADDFSRSNPIHRWWGGTELTNDRLWRWDPETSSLIAPQL